MLLRATPFSSPSPVPVLPSAAVSCKFARAPGTGPADLTLPGHPWLAHDLHACAMHTYVLCMCRLTYVLCMCRFVGDADPVVAESCVLALDMLQYWGAYKNPPT
jgi:hypothetical protein